MYYEKKTNREPVEILGGVITDYDRHFSAEIGGGIFIPYFYNNEENGNDDFRDSLFEFLEKWYPDYVKEWKKKYPGQYDKGFQYLNVY